MKNSTYYLILGLLFGVFSCKTPQNSASNNKKFDMDLSKFRVEYADTILDNSAPQRPVDYDINLDKYTSSSQGVKNVDNQLNEHLRKIAINNKKIKYSYGYIVQVYSGGDRQEANSHIRQARNITDETVKLEYKEPNYKVFVGNYLSRPQAYLTYTQVKSVFPSAVIIPGKVEIERYKYDGKVEDKTTEEDEEIIDDQK